MSISDSADTTVKIYDFCKSCDTTDPSLLYRSRRMPNCKDCQNYANLVTKSKGKCAVGFTREDFVAWKRASSKTCHYCGIAETHLYDVGIVNPRTKRIVETMGVDRIDPHGDYAFDNIVLCCAGCNYIKSNALTEEEMLIVGKTMRGIWMARLVEKSILPDSASSPVINAVV